MKPIQAYVAASCIGAVLFLTVQDWSLVPEIAVRYPIGLLILFGLGLLSESLTVRFADSKGGGTHTITFLPLLASVLLFDPAVAVIFFGLTGAFAEFLIRRKQTIRALFNVAQYVIATALAGLAYSQLQTLDYLASYTTTSLPVGWVESIIWPFLAFATVFFGVNHVAVSLAITISQEAPFKRTWRSLVGKSGAGIMLDLLISPMAVLVALLYVEVSWPGLLIAFLPLLFIRHAYLTNYRLTEANQDLLKVLVKAIETRDPYTSGHSQRVAGLARRIAEALRLPARRVKDIETAALLHDIGKIEAIYTEILRKPEDLTPEERGIIESHVTKGVELLESLSSFSDDIIAAVRHHHERVDGKGYPDGLRRDAISIGGKIIKVCDAIDAMLSDRPYRNALTIDQVQEQLETYSGIQFDPDVVECVRATDILQEHIEEIRAVGARHGGDRTESRRVPGQQKEMGSLKSAVAQEA